MKYIINPKNYYQVKDIAEQNELDVAELTSGMNGYPKNLRHCVTGFDSYQEAEDFADKYNGNVTSIRKRDGWQLSESQGTMYKPFTAYDVENDDNLTETHYTYDVWTYDIAVEFDSLNIRTLDDLADYINSCDELPNDLEKICDDNCWDMMDDEWHICNDGDEQIILNDKMEAVITEYNG